MSTTLIPEEIISPEVAQDEVDQISVNLEAAADYIDKYGWHQGSAFEYGDSYRSGTRPAVCMLGALYMGLGGEDRLTAIKAIDRISKTLRLSESVPHLITLWNDTLGRTKEEVCRTLREAAANGG